MEGGEGGECKGRGNGGDDVNVRGSTGREGQERRSSGAGVDVVVVDVG